MGAQSPTQFLGLSGSTALSTPSYAGTPGPGPAPNPWKVDGATIYYDEGGALLTKEVAGGSKGKGTINAQGVFENGQRISQGSGPPSGPAGGSLAAFYPDPEIAADVELPGSPTTTTQPLGTDDDTVATTGFVQEAIDALPPVSVQQGGVAFGGTGGAITSDVAHFGWDGSKLTISAADLATAMLIAGTTKGVRFVPTATAFYIQGVDQTGSGTDQPIFITGTEVSFGSPALGMKLTPTALTIGSSTTRNAVVGLAGGAFQNLALRFDDNSAPSVCKFQNFGITGANQGVTMQWDLGTTPATSRRSAVVGVYATDTYASPANESAEIRAILRQAGAETTAATLSLASGLVLPVPARATRVGAGMAPNMAATSVGWFNGDITLSGANHAFMANLYYEAGWKYTVSGASGGAIKMGVDPAIPFQLLVAPNNTGAAGAAAVPVLAFSSDVAGVLTAGVGMKSVTPPAIAVGTEVVTAAWVKANVQGGASVGLVPPATPSPGQLWFYSDNIANGGTMYCWYDDGSTQQWVPASTSPPGSIIPPGSIMDFAGTTAPSGWLLCQGQNVTRTGPNAALFAAIGITYGPGDGSTTFTLPDLRGRMTAGLDPGGAAGRLTVAISGVDGAVVGAAGGDQRDQLHTHTINDSHTHNMTQGGPGPTSYTGRACFGDGINAGVYGGVLSGATTTISANNFGAGASQNVPPVMIMNKMIKQ